MSKKRNRNEDGSEVGHRVLTRKPVAWKLINRHPVRKIDYTKGENWRLGVAEAACIIEKRGWSNNALHEPNTYVDQDGIEHDVAGPVCMLGALNTVATSCPDNGNCVARFLAQRLLEYINEHIGPYDCIPALNDGGEITRADVLRIMRNAAKKRR